VTLRTREQIVERARLHVGHREITPNRSPLIDAWLRRCGLGPGYPWCAAFASWCVEERADRKLGGTLPVAIAGAQNLGKSFPPTTNPQPGDLMWFPLDKGTGHAAPVAAVRETEALCIEGNSNNRVRYVRRLRSEVKFSSTRVEAWPADIPHPVTDEDWANAPLVRVESAGTR